MGAGAGLWTRLLMLDGAGCRQSGDGGSSTQLALHCILLTVKWLGPSLHVRTAAGEKEDKLATDFAADSD
jgi:hypothetical protein